MAKKLYRMRMNGKELLSIHEFAKFTGLEQTTLRYWDDIGLFSPVQRNEENNYRCYAPQQITTVNFITVLSKLGIPLKTISSIEGERTPENIVELIEQQENKLDMEMRRLRESYSIIHRLRDLIRSGLKADTGVITTATLEDTSYIPGPPNDFTDDKYFYETFMRFCQEAKRLRINLGYPVGGYFSSMEAFLAEPSHPDYFISVDPTGYDKRPAGEYIVGYTYGYYGEMGDLPQRMADYALAHGLVTQGPLYVVYIHDEICIHEPSRYLSRASVAFTRAPGAEEKTSAVVWEEVPANRG
ncbi:MAG: MerR family transcriptional regulator [Oscillospiraceae bacterium]|jgi:DNA-binding transcriptional MerR regulator|nr:MerR family transcriptional regulator [Oscillospiraceae bacterium]